MGEHVRVLDYGIGNLRSIQRALEAAGARVEVSATLEGPAADRLVLPGVGAFAEAMRLLEPHRRALDVWLTSGRPLLGICLGMQLLFESSREHGETRGLGWFQGDVVPMTGDVTIPNMGWHRLNGLGDPYVYLAHSFGVRSSPDATATLEHGETWVAAVRRGAVHGYQFHPEKSGRAGIALLREWLRC